MTDTRPTNNIHMLSALEHLARAIDTPDATALAQHFAAMGDDERPSDTIIDSLLAQAALSGYRSTMYIECIAQVLKLGGWRPWIDVIG